MSVNAIRGAVRVWPAAVAAVSLGFAQRAEPQVPQAPAKAVPLSAEWARVDRIMGREGKVQPGGVHRYGFPRGDLRVVIQGVTVKPGLALGSWVAFEGAGSDAMAMGDLVLAEREVTPVLTRLEQTSVHVTALHNHVLGESPRVMYLHIQACGDAAKIAEAVHSALALTGTPAANPSDARPSAAFALDTAQISAVLGYRGSLSSGVYQVSVPRAETVRADGMEVPPSMGVATAINFQSTGSGKAAITGDFVLLAGEVNPVIQALRGGGIEVTAVHSHMLGEEPRLFFLHYWANADALALARGLRSALDRMNVKKGDAR